MVTVKGNVAEFSFYRPDAMQVFLAGDFSDWNTKLPMVRDADGYWRTQLRLPGGDFKFRYFADGRWYTDYAAFGVEYGPFGLDSVLRIPHGQATA